MSSLAEAARVGHGRGRQESERQIDLEQSLSDPSVVMRLDQRLMGRSKEEIVTSLGPPLAASMQERAVIEAGVAGMAVGSFWETDTWYYPFRPRQQAAVAIVFQADRVVKVDLIVIPQ